MCLFSPFSWRISHQTPKWMTIGGPEMNGTLNFVLFDVANGAVQQQRGTMQGGGLFKKGLEKRGQESKWEWLLPSAALRQPLMRLSQKSGCKSDIWIANWKRTGPFHEWPAPEKARFPQPACPSVCPLLRGRMVLGPHEPSPSQDQVQRASRSTPRLRHSLPCREVKELSKCCVSDTKLVFWLLCPNEYKTHQTLQFHLKTTRFSLSVPVSGPTAAQ